MKDYHLAEFNVARLRKPLDHEESVEFLAALGPVNALAEATPGYIWRLQDEQGQSASFVSVPEIDDPLVIVNYSIWSGLESLKHFVYRSGHASYLKRRKDWFMPQDQPSTVCWWTPAGEIPEVREAYRRLQNLRSEGTSEAGWPISQPRPMP
ncbi:MAG: DUF3291 domain-containing protein [Acidimicrobiales bacterium]